MTTTSSVSNSIRGAVAIRRLASERASARAGRSALLAKLAEALFIETLRRYMAELPRQRTRWLVAARDSAVGARSARSIATRRAPGRSRRWPSEPAAFNRAFKREFDVPPARYRRRRRTADRASAGQ